MQFSHFNALRGWLLETKPEQVKLFVFDCDPNVRNWVEVNADGERI
jgi:hypothetical protein